MNQPARCEQCGRLLGDTNPHTICRDCGSQPIVATAPAVAIATNPSPTRPASSAAVPDQPYIDAFVQSRAFDEAFERFDRQGGYAFTFHWGAALLDAVLGPVWFIYRKLYVWAVGLFFANGVLVMLLPANPDGVDGTSVVRAIVTGVLHGSLAHYAYWRKTTEAVRTERRKSTNETEVLKALSRQGGTNPVAAVAFALLLLVGSFLFGVIVALENMGML